MYRRPYPYDSSYYFYPPPQSQYFNPSTYQPNEPSNTMPPYYSAHHQTPFQHFTKPSQASNWPDTPNYQQNYEGFYDQSNPIHSQPSPSFLTQFQNEDGQMDINKMLSTVGQIVNTVQQVSPVIQQFGSIVKSFR